MLAALDQKARRLVVPANRLSRRGWRNDCDNQEGPYQMRFNVVTANPPFSLDKSGTEHAAADPFKCFWRGIPPMFGTIAGSLHCLSYRRSFAP